jgi:hypothetical protein
VWAIAENNNLRLSDLGIPVSSIETQPTNVRAWIFQLIAMSPATAEANREYIELEAYAAGLPLYARFQRISYDGSNDLFRSMTVMNTTINGGIQAGAVSINGNATNTGATNVHYQPQTIEAIQTELMKAIREIHPSAADADLKEQALEHVRAAQATPTQDKLTKAISFLDKVEAVTSKVQGVGTSITTLGTIAASIAKLAGLY